MRKLLFTSLLLMVTHAPASGAPGQVTGFTAMTDLQVKLNWTAPGASDYTGNVTGGLWEIRYSSISGATYDTAEYSLTISSDWAQGASQTLLLTCLKPGAPYAFWIRAQDSTPGNWSAWSDTNTIAGLFVDTGMSFVSASRGCVAWGDYDGDGRPDLAVVGPSDTRIYHNVNGTLVDTGNSLEPVNDGMGSCLVWGDYDNDGDLDLTIAGYFRVCIYRNDNGTFTKISASLPGGLIHPFLAWTDYDNDGDLDLHVGGYGDNATKFDQLYRNNKGVFTDANAGLIPAQSGCAVWGDYDNDGDLDFALAAYDQWAYGFTKIYRNTNGTFADSGISLAVGNVAAWGDFDNDGRLDLAIAGGSSGMLSIYRNTASGFVSVGTGLIGVTNASLAWGDYDNDGDLDLLVTGHANSGDLTMLYRNDNGTFVPQPSGLPNAQKGSAAWGDIDNDGDLDLAFTSPSGTKLYRSLFDDFGTANSSPTVSACTSSYNSAAQQLEFRWSDGTDDHTPAKGLNYAVRAGTTTPLGRTNAQTISWLPATPMMGGYPHSFAVASSTQPGMNLKGIAEGTSVYWQVQAIDPGFRAGDWSGEQVLYVPVTAPGKVTGLTAATGFQMSLSWYAPGNDGYAGNVSSGTWQVNYSSAPDATADTARYTLMISTTWAQGARITMPVEGLLPGVTYYFWVRARDGIQGNWSAWSDTSSAIAGLFGMNASTFVNLQGVSLAWGDYDNDGRLDLVISGGPDSYSTAAKLYRNNGNGTFSENTAAGLAGAKGGSVAWVDYDNDGRLDLAMNGSNVTKLYHNNGNGTFSENAAVSFPGTQNASLAWGDYDNDGRPDIVFSGYNGAYPYHANITRLYHNNGDGTFTENTPSNFFNMNQGSLAWGDYDNDGRLDIAIGGYDGSYITKLFHNNGDGTFSENAAANLINVGLCSLAWGDYDNDGRLDLVVAGFRGVSPYFFTKLYHNDGNGVFSEDVSANLAGVESASVAWGDYDNDGWLDLVVTGQCGLYPVAKLYHNSGDGTFVEVNACLPGIKFGSLAWGDYDGDGDLDLAFAGYTGNNIYVTNVYKSYVAEGGNVNAGPGAPSNLTESYNAALKRVEFRWNKGTDTRTSPEGLYYDVRVATAPITDEVKKWTISPSTGAGMTPFLGNYPHGFCVASSTQPGVDLSTFLSDTTFYWQVRSINPGLKKSAWVGSGLVYVPPQPPQRVSPTVAQDLQAKLSWVAPANGINSSHCDSYLVKYSTMGDIADEASFLAATTYYQTWTPAAPGVAEAQILTGLPAGTTVWFSIKSSFGGRWSMISSTGTNFAVSGAFGDIGTALAGVRYASLAWGDYDNDGRPDLAVAGYTGSTYITKLYRNNGDATFTEDTAASLTGVQDCSLAWGDYDNDGRLDLAVAGYTGSTYITKLYHNNGDGTFTADTAANLAGVRNCSIAWGDYDNDGWPDLAVAGYNGSANITKLYHNNGDGTFAENSGANIVGIQCASLAWGDYDNDGRLDLAVAGNNGSAKVTKLYHNNGDGSFTEDFDASLFGVNYGSLAWGDYDNDGRLDLAVAGTNGSTNITKLYHNNGGGIFAEDSAANLIGVDYSSLAWGDYDNDGYADLVVTGHDGTNRMTKIYRNNQGGGTFTDTNACLPGVYNGNLSWGDHDGDGDLDLALAGNGSDGDVTKVYRSYVAESGNANTGPTAPGGLDTSFNAASGNLEFRWSQSTDPRTPSNGLFYDIRVATEPVSDGLKKWVVSPSTGAGMSPFMGNYPHGFCVAASTQAGVNLAPPLSGVTYYWQVRAINPGLQRSTWSACQSVYLDIPMFVVPASAFNNTFTTMTIRGCGITPESTVMLSRAGQPDVLADSVTFVSQGILSCVFSLAGRATGYWDVTVSTGGVGSSNTTFAGGFYLDAMGLDAIEPAMGYNSGPVNITKLQGKGFLKTSTFRLTRDGANDIAASTVTFIDSRLMTCTFPLAGAATGYWDVVVDAGGPPFMSARLTNGFFVATMRVSSCTPAAVFDDNSISLTLTGNGFVNGSTVRASRAGHADAVASSVIVVNSSSITCTLSMMNKAAGYWDVTVSTGGPGSVNATLQGALIVSGHDTPGAADSPWIYPDIDFKGNTFYVTWNKGGTVKFSESRDKGLTWARADVTGSVGGAPAIAVDDAGNIYIVFYRGGSVYCRRSTDGGATFPDADERFIAANGGTRPNIVIRNDKIYVANCSYVSTGSVTSYTFGSTVAVAGALLASSNSGQNVYYMGNTSSLYYTGCFFSTNYGATFSAGAGLESIYGAYQVYRPAIAAANENNVYIAYWADKGGPSNCVRFARSNDAGSSFNTVNFETTGLKNNSWSENGSTSDQRIALAASGSKVILASDIHLNGAYPGVKWATSVDYGATFRPLAYPGTFYHDPAVALNESGEGVVVMTMDDGAGYSIVTSSAPKAITNLEALPGLDGGEIRLTWTTPDFEAAPYDLRMSTSPIDDYSFAASSPITYLPQSLPANTMVGPYPVTGLVGNTTYYFAIKTANQLWCTSLLSNVAHGVPYNTDISSPCTVADLTAESLPFALRLSWTAPGDNGVWGNLAPPPNGGYILKYSTNIIASEIDFENAQEYSQAWAPKGAGQKDARMVTGLDLGRRYYFALKAYDDGHNISPLSNAADAVTSGISLGEIYPKSGTNDRSRIIVFRGLGFENGMTAKLKRVGKTDIDAVAVSVNSVFCASVTFNLSNVASGLWDVEVAKGNQTATLPGAFFVNIPEPQGSGWSWDKKAIGFYYGTLDIVAADLDGDGVSEIYSVDGGTVTRNTSDGKAWTKTVVAMEGVNQVRKLGVGDADNDGKYELYAGGAGSLFMYRYSPGGWLRTVVSGMADVRAIAVADVDNDGLRELYCADGSDLYRVRVIGPGQVEKELLPKPAGVTSWSSAMCFAAGDADGDGKTELYIGDSSTNLCLYRLCYDGVNWNYSLIEGHAAYSLAVCDADNDGVQELYAAIGDGQNRLCRYRYTGSLWEKTVLLNRYSDSLIAADGDNDGNTEIYGRTSGVTGTEFNGSGWSDTALDSWGTLVKLVAADAMGDGFLGLYAFYSNKNSLFQFKRRALPQGGFSRSFPIYNDAGSLRAPGVYQGNSGSLGLSSDYSTAAEGTYSMKAHIASPQSNSWAGTYIDGSQNMYDYYYNGGSLKFSIRFSSPPPVNLVIGMRSSNQAAGFENSKVYLSNYLASPSSNTWYTVAIPLLDFYTADQNLDFNRMAVFFNLAYTGPTCGGVWEGDIWFDDVSWVKPDSLDRIDIIPAAASLYPGSRRTFTPLYYNRFGDPVVSTSVPHWSVSNGVGEVSPADGPITVFTATATARNDDIGFVICQAGGKTGSALVTISTQTWAQSYEIYDDTGIPYGSDIYTWEADDNETVAEITDETNAPEGKRYMRQTVDSAFGGWGVVFTTNSMNGIRDLSEYNGGSLQLWVKTPENLKVEMQESGPTGLKKSVHIGDYGWDATNSWQEITVPVSDFLVNGGVDLSKVHAPFLVTADAPCSFEVDGVRLVTNVTNPGPAKVQIIGKRLYVNNQPFVVRGVCGDFIPSGGNATCDWSLDPDNYVRDIPLLKAMGANVVRLYKQPSNQDALKAFADNKIYCIMTYWVGASDIANPDNVKTGFMSMVRNWMSSPAVLAWCIGNETNTGLSGSDLKSWYDLVETCAKAAHEEESAAGITYHPVTTANAEIGQIGNAAYDADDAKLAHLDFWSVQVYRGASFGNLFTDFRSRSNKPLLITEFGCDAWDGTNGHEDQHTQAQIILGQWNEIVSNLATDANPSGTMLGGVVFQWRDTWNKSFSNSLGDAGHDTVADWTNAAYPDPSMNEEWWGICGVSTVSRSSRQLREVYTTLRSTWNPSSLFTVSIRNISDDSPADKITWNSVPSLPGDWKAASQYVKIETAPDFDHWGIQVYTDNCAPDADPRFYITEPSSCDPAGLVRVSDRKKVLKMCWRITDQLLASPSADLAIAEQYTGQGLKLFNPSIGAGYDCYHWIKDRKTPTIPSENTTAFKNGEDYVTIWEAVRGLHHRESEWFAGNASPNYLYIGACFKDAVTPETYRAKLIIEFFVE